MINQVRANIGGKWYDLAYNSSTARYEAEITPEESSYAQTGGQFNVSVEATNDIGVSTSVDANTFSELYLIVKETTPPDIVIISPAEGYITTNTPRIIANISDTQSGVFEESIAVFVDGNSQDFTVQSIDSGYQIQINISTPLSDGNHTVRISALDNDNNFAEKIIAYFVDTIPPSLVISSPDSRHIVDVEEYLLSGISYDAGSSLKSIQATVNGTDIGDINLLPNGVFSKIIPLNVGVNDFAVIATDNAGLKTSVNFRLIRLITDRTQKDVDIRDIVRGSYRASDLNRVYDAMDLLNQIFTDMGYIVQYERYKVYGDESTPTETDFFKYLENLKFIRGVLPVQNNTPLVPSSMKWLTYKMANDIEKILVMIDELFIGLKSVWYSGEIMSGEI